MKSFSKKLIKILPSSNYTNTFNVDNDAYELFGICRLNKVTSAKGFTNNLLINSFLSKKAFFLLILCCAFLYINEVSPLRCDDLIYQYFWQEERINDFGEPIDLNNKINNFNEAFCSQINHYKVMNGRFIAHYIVQCFCGFLGKPLFNYINTFVFLLFNIGCIKLIGFNTQEKKTFATAFLWLGLPILHIFYYSIAFSVNYLWSSTALIYLLIIIKKTIESVPKKKSALHILWIFVCSFFLSSFHEGFSLPICGVLFLYIIRHRKHINTELIVIAASVLIATSTLVLAPGIIQRGNNSITSYSLNDLITMKLNIIQYSKRFTVLLSILAFLYFINKEYLRIFLKRRSTEISFIIISICFVFSIPHYSQRISFPYEMLSLLLFIELLTEQKFWNTIHHYVYITIVISTLIQLPIVIYYSRAVSKEYTNMLREYQESPRGITHYQTMSIPKPINPYVKRLDNDVERNYISFTFGKDMVIEE